MRYALKVMELMAPFPGREFRMAGLVRYATAGRVMNERERRAARKAVHRVLKELVQNGSVLVSPAKVRGEGANYAWRTEVTREPSGGVSDGEKVRHAVVAE